MEILSEIIFFLIEISKKKILKIEVFKEKF